MILLFLEMLSFAHNGCKLVKWKHSCCCEGIDKSKLEQGLIWSTCHFP